MLAKNDVKWFENKFRKMFRFVHEHRSNALDPLFEIGLHYPYHRIDVPS